MTRAIPVLINRSGGVAASLGHGLRSAVEEAFASVSRPVEIEMLAGAEIGSAVRRHAGAPLIVVGGGDGTLGAAASVLAHTASALGILPLGRRNHLARQLGVPLDLAGAARLIGNGQRRRMDLGLAGDRIFVNSASLGIYTRLVHGREADPDASWTSKWLRGIPASWRLLRNMRSQLFPVWLDDKARELATPLLFVGNSAYPVDHGLLGERDGTTEGELSVFAVSAQSRSALIGFALRAMLGLGDPERDLAECETAREIVIEGAGAIEGAFDGELATLPLPLEIRILPNALGVVVPRETVADLRELSPTRTHG